MVARLQEPRLRGSVGGSGGPEEADRLYAALFAEHGLNVAGDPGTIAAQIRGSAIRDQLIFALEDWAGVKNGVKRGSGAGLRAIIRLADNDPWRQQIRGHFEAKNFDLLKQIAQADDVMQQPPANLLLLTKMLNQKGVDGLPLYYQLMRRGQRRYPSDFWLNHELGNALSFRATFEKTDQTESIGFFRAAIALQPQYPEPYFNLGLALWQAHAHADAFEALKKAIELRPDFLNAHEIMAHNFAEDGRWADAETAYRHIRIDLVLNSIALGEVLNK
jgi:tetratricopeptide (TPR) repeat protein